MNTVRPLRILAASMVGSGSTFLYNVAREILESDPRLKTLATYSDEWNPRFDGNHHLLLKSHWGVRALLPLAERGYLRPVITTRHPGDCVCSDMDRFGFSFNFALKRVDLSLKFVGPLRALPDTLPFRYEDRFTAGTITAESLTRLFGLKLDSSRLTNISRKYDAAATRAYAAKLESLPKLNRSPDNPDDVWCPITQIHRGHIGKLVSGRWRDLPADHRRAIADLCGEEASAFGYEFDD
ncbi:MAG TPA: hypothetical protein VKZ79_20685 [Alphaproteobacteria bacterium]|nr:hypothetical protein [Alphaproteobacteria bacterium]